MEPRQDYMLNSLRVCIDRYDDVKMGGRAYSPLQSEVIEFEDFMEMIAQADKLFDEKGYPQSYQNKRMFDGESQRSSFVMKPLVLRETKDIIGQQGKIGTFDILVVSRRHATWQGSLKDQKGNIIGDFEDILQIISCMEKYRY